MEAASQVRKPSLPAVTLLLTGALRLVRQLIKRDIVFAASLYVN